MVLKTGETLFYGSRDALIGFVFSTGCISQMVARIMGEEIEGGTVASTIIHALAGLYVFVIFFDKFVLASSLGTESEAEWQDSEIS
jgi:Na+/H+ antiporter NhaC